FACTRGADQGNRLAWLRVKRDVTQCRQTVAVAEADIFVTDIAHDTVAAAVGCGSPPRGRGYKIVNIPAGLDRFIHDLEYALTGRAAGLHELIELMQFSDWFIKKIGEQQE